MENGFTMGAPLEASARGRLSLRRRRFVEHYVQTGKPREAAILAGYAVSSAAATAAHLLRDSGVQAALQEVSATAGIDAVGLARQAHEIAAFHGMVLTDADGDEHMRDGALALKANESLVKRFGLGAAEPETQINITPTMYHVVEVPQREVQNEHTGNTLEGDYQTVGVPRRRGE